LERTFCNKTIIVEDNKVNLEITKFINRIEKILDTVDNPLFHKWMAELGIKRLLHVFNYDHLNDKRLNEEENNLKNVNILDRLDDAQFILNQIEDLTDKEKITNKLSYVISYVSSTF
jgi:hypothetical protein